jgi:hypothetical protein
LKEGGIGWGNVLKMIATHDSEDKKRKNKSNGFVYSIFSAPTRFLINNSIIHFPKLRMGAKPFDRLTSH